VKTRFETAYQTTKNLLATKTDVDVVIARYMFEKFGTLPEEVTEMDDYQKGIVFAFLEDIVNVHNEQMKKQEREARIARVRRR
jgi:adenine/guanine phosphoribosyltransferase-like PRPP-binding protein